MRNLIKAKIHTTLERWLPERRVFLRSDTETRFVRLRSETQLMVLTGAAAVLVWAIVSTSILVMDSIGAGNYREQAQRDRISYEIRLNELSRERDQRAEEAAAAQARFNSALAQISTMQSQLLDSETRRLELSTGIDVIQSTLQRTVKERDLAREKADLAAGISSPADTTLLAEGAPLTETVDILSAVLRDTAAERDKIADDAQSAFAAAEEMEYRLKVVEDRNEEIFRQLEEAMTISVEPLDKMFRNAGLNTDSLLRTVRRGYSGLGGPLTPLSLSTRGEEPSEDALRANRILDDLDKLNVYRIAAQKAPFALPVKNAFRFTSGFGMRWGRMHNGTDFAAAHGTPIYATADGVVTSAGWGSGYGNLIKIQHEFGIETRYAHLSRIRVKVGQRVSRGTRIGDMGNTGRSTGTHLHYEVRVGGKAVNPMMYIKAANNVF